MFWELALTSHQSWDDDALKATIRNFAGVGSDAGGPPVTRFASSVTALIRKRITRGEDSRALPGVFFLQPAPPESVPDTQHFPMLDNGLESVCGRYWFTTHLANDGRAFEIDAGANDAEIFRVAIEDLGVGRVPAVILDMRTPQPEIRFYPDGLENTQSAYLVPFNLTEITIEEIFLTVEGLHSQALVTPDVQGRTGKLWADSRKKRPMPDAEDRIQTFLRYALLAKYPSCTVRAEQSQATGRLDLEIEESNPEDRSVVVRHAILELKVLRSRGSTGAAYSAGDNEDWIEKGVRQAWSYRVERGARLSALCCFDMRDDFLGHRAFDHVIELALRLEVSLGNWHLFSSSEDYRAHLVDREVGA